MQQTIGDLARLGLVAAARGLDELLVEVAGIVGLVGADLFVRRARACGIARRRACSRELEQPCQLTRARTARKMPRPQDAIALALERRRVDRDRVELRLPLGFEAGEVFVVDRPIRAAFAARTIEREQCRRAVAIQEEATKRSGDRVRLLWRERPEAPRHHRVERRWAAEELEHAHGLVGGERAIVGRGGDGEPFDEPDVEPQPMARRARAADRRRVRRTRARARGRARSAETARSSRTARCATAWRCTCAQRPSATASRRRTRRGRRAPARAA